MSLRRVLVVAALALLSIAAIAGAGLVWLTQAPRRTPVGQPALSRLDAPTLPAFRDAFNQATEETRVILLLSPT
jgi:uncharacterized membrane protein